MKEKMIMLMEVSIEKIRLALNAVNDKINGCFEIDDTEIEDDIFSIKIVDATNWEYKIADKFSFKWCKDDTEEENIERLNYKLNKEIAYIEEWA